MDIISGIIGGIVGTVGGGAATILTVRYGLVSEKTFDVYKTAVGDRLNTLCKDVKGVHTRLDATNKELSELVGFLRGKPPGGHGPH